MATRKPTHSSEALSAELPDEPVAYVNAQASLAASVPSSRPALKGAEANDDSEHIRVPIDKPRVLRSSSVTPSVSSNDYSADIRVLIENLRRDNYLPVIFFGGSNSGKTQVFTSLMKFFKVADSYRNPNNINVSFGSSLVDESTAYGKKQREYSERHFREVVDTAVEGLAAEATRAGVRPFFIPVTLKAQIDGQVVEQNFAFMEGNGEWLHVSTDSSKPYFPTLKEEVIGLFKAFDGDMGLAIVYTAPCDLKSSETEELQNQDYLKRLRVQDLALGVGLNGYIDKRARKDKDKHIFLLTKWDAVNKIQGFADQIDVKSFDSHKTLSLSAEDSMKLANTVADKIYTSAYALFKSPNLVSSESQRVFLPYSAGVFSGRNIDNTNATDKFDRYIKSLWNELFFAAGHTKPLFPPPPRWKKFLNIIFG